MIIYGFTTELLFLLLLRGGRSRLLFLIYCTLRLSSNHSWFIYSSSLAITGRHLVAKKEKLG